MSADSEEVQMLREELVLELERAARRGAMAETERAGLQSTLARADSPVEQT